MPEEKIIKLYFPGNDQRYHEVSENSGVATITETCDEGGHWFHLYDGNGKCISKWNGRYVEGVEYK